METSSNLTALELAERQHGLLSRWQLRALGTDRASVGRALAQRRWIEVTPRTLRLAGAPVTPAQQVMAAVLDAGPGAVASHRAAGWLWRYPGFDACAEVSLVRGANGRGAALGVVHRPRNLAAHHVSSVAGVPVTTPERTLCDLAGVVGPGRLARVVDSALAADTADLARLWITFADLAARGRPGRGRLRRILADRPPGYIAPESELEARFVALVDMAGMAQPERQVVLGDGDRIGRVDFFFRAAGVVVEVDGRLGHSALLDRQADARRDGALRAMGLQVVRFGWADVVLAPEATLACLRRSLSAPTAAA